MGCVSLLINEIIVVIFLYYHHFQVDIYLPTDVITGDAFSADAKVGACTVETGVPDGWMVGRSWYCCYYYYFY